MSSSGTESEPETKEPISRLGECEVCGSANAIYTCPKCDVKTCCLKCVVIHKKELECDGIRDRTKFIRMKQFTDGDLLSDYKLLEECARFVYGIKRNDKKKFTRIDKDLPIHLYKLKMAAKKRGIVLQFLAQNFTRHSLNTTRYHYKTDTIQWRIEWIFPNAEPDPIKFVDEKCSERKKLSDLLDKYLNLDNEPFEGSKSLLFYQSVGFSGVKILLRAEKVKGSSRKYFELDPTESLAENLSGKCVVEFPIIFVVLKDHAYNFDIITPEDEFDYKEETQERESKNSEEQLNHELSNVDLQNQNGTLVNGYQSRKRPKQLLTEKIAYEKKKEIENEIKAAKKKKPKNLLFTTGYSSDESLAESEDDTETVK